jgi:cholesterol transport system auxiliary component
MKLLPFLPLALALLLPGCAGHAVAPDMAEYGLPAVSAGASPLLRSVDVGAPSWFSGWGIQYRQAYADAARRSSYANSRWIAPPPEMLERFLARSLTGEGKSAPGICRLQIELDEFQQVFDTPQASRGVLTVRATLLAQGGTPLARHSFSAARPAGSPDAHGGIAALGLAAGDMSRALGLWLDGMSPEIAQACRSR